VQVANEFVFGEVNGFAAALELLEEEGVRYDGLFGGCEGEERDYCGDSTNSAECVSSC